MKLFIIGNGFDIRHNIPCRYSQFYEYLRENRVDVLEMMEKFYYVGVDSDLWSDFEASLERDIKYDSLIEIIGENAPNFTSDEFRDSDWYDAQIYVEQECDELLDSIRSGFEDWIGSLEVNRVKMKFILDRMARYITFNYTDTLETIYKIPSSQILHIHNQVGEKLIFGHGKSVEDFNVREALYENENAFLSYDENGEPESNEVGHEKYAEESVCRFYDRMRKNTEQIIKNHLDFFSKISDINEVFVLGHSFNEIDMPYFEIISRSISDVSKWNLFYLSDRDRENAENLMKTIRIPIHLQNYRQYEDLEIVDNQMDMF